MVVLFLLFYRTSILFSIVTIAMYTSTGKKVPLSPHSLHHFWFVDFLMMAILTSVRWYPFVVLIYVSLIIGNVEHLSMCLLVICLSSLEKCLFRSSAIFFLNWIVYLFTFILNSMSSLYIHDINPLSVAWIANIFPHSEGCLSYCLCFPLLHKFFFLN